jgi:hypothetical protein
MKRRPTEHYSIFDIYTDDARVKAVALGKIGVIEAILHNEDVRNCFSFKPKDCSQVGRFALEIWDMERSCPAGVPVTIQSPGFGALWVGKEDINGDAPVLFKASEAVERPDSFHFQSRWYVGLANSKEIANSSLPIEEALADRAIHRPDMPDTKSAVDLLVALCPPEGFELTDQQRSRYEQLMRLKQAS